MNRNIKNIAKKIRLLTCLIPLLVGCKKAYSDDSGIDDEKNKTRIAFMQTKLSSLKNDYILVAAHRGSHKIFPENSMAAFYDAIKIGADIVEVDISTTKDGILVLMHDETIDRTTNGKGLVSSYTYEELQSFFLKDKQGNVTTNKIPALKDVLKAAVECQCVLVNIDKASNLFKEVSEVVQAENARDVIIIKSNIAVNEILENASWLRGSMIMPTIHLDRWSDPVGRIDQLIANLHPLLFEIVFEHDDSESFLKLQDSKQYQFKFWYTTTSNIATGGHSDHMAVALGNKDESWGWLVDHKASVIMTDYPEELIEYLKSINKRVE